MKKVITLRPARYNGEDIPAGTILDIEDDIYTIWRDIGLVKDYDDLTCKIENNLRAEDSIKPTKKKGQVKKNVNKDI